MIEQYFFIGVKRYTVHQVSESQIQSATEHVQKKFYQINKNIKRMIEMGADRTMTEIRYMDEVMAMTDALFCIGINVQYERKEVNIHDLHNQ